ncbi:MAG: hypothetical protein ABIT01_18905 [Thermoanaerobaculia bacterium]
MTLDAPDPSAQTPPPPPPAPPPVAFGKGRNVGMLVLSYLWAFALIPYLMEKNDPEVKWHARHGLVLLGAEIALWMALMFTSFILHFLFLLYPVYWLAVLVLHAVLISKALSGERMLLPEISKYADRI